MNMNMGIISLCLLDNKTADEDDDRDDDDNVVDIFGPRWSKDYRM